MAETLRLIGAGLPRTGTHSLRVALERLLGGTCYHMSTLFERDARDVPAFAAASRGEPADWDAVLDGCTAGVDWPISHYWAPLAERHPDAVVLLSERDSAQTWWRSADATVFGVFRTRLAMRDELDASTAAWLDLIMRQVRDVFGPDWDDPDEAMGGYTRWNDRVRAEAPADRLVVWHPGDGWEPLCEALGLDVPDEPYPHTNTTDEFVARQVERAQAASADR